MNALDRTLGALSLALMSVAGAAILGMMLLVVLDVTLKYLLSQPIPGTLEMVSYYGMAACAFLPFAYVQRSGQHIAMTLVVDRLPAKARERWGVVVNLVCAAYLLVFAWASGAEAIDATGISESTSAIIFEIHIWPARWCVPVATATMALAMILQALRPSRPQEAHHG